MLKRFFRRLFIIVGSLLLLLVVLLLLLITPGEPATTAISSNDVAQTRNWLSSTWLQLKQDKVPIAIEINQQQLDAIMNVATYSIKAADFDGVINNFGINLHASLNLAPYLPGKVIQGSCLLLPSDNGLTIDQCRLGRIPVSGWLANHSFKLAVKTAISAPADQQLLTLFARGKLSDNTLYFVNEKAIALELNINPKLLSLHQLAKEAFVAEPQKAEDMLFYLRTLQDLYTAAPAERRLAYYLQQILLQASNRAGNSSLQQEQTKALWAIIACLGNPQFIRHANPELTVAQVPALPAMKLAGRHDLTLHFLYSAFFKLVGNNNIAETIGNLKEIYDAGNKSGFSFVDLAADYAGIYFAENISGINLEKMKSFSVAEFEAAFMPNIAGLPEGLSEQQMQRQFGGYQGQLFEETEQIIINRLQQLTLYR